MQESEFFRLMDEEFGPARAGALVSCQSITALGGHTAEQLLDAGHEPKEIWEALATQMGVPESRLLGRDIPLRENRDKY